MSQQYWTISLVILKNSIQPSKYPILISTQRPLALNGTPDKITFVSQLLNYVPLPTLPSEHLSLTLLRSMMSLVGSLPQSSRSRYSYSNSGNRKLAGMTPYHNLSWMSGYNGALSYTSSHTSTSLDVMLTRSFKALQCNSMDSVMPLSEPMGQSFMLE